MTIGRSRIWSATSKDSEVTASIYGCGEREGERVRARRAAENGERGWMGREVGGAAPLAHLREGTRLTPSCAVRRSKRRHRGVARQPLSPAPSHLGRRFFRVRGGDGLRCEASAAMLAAGVGCADGSDGRDKGPRSRHGRPVCTQRGDRATGPGEVGRGEESHGWRGSRTRKEE